MEKKWYDLSWNAPAETPSGLPTNRAVTPDMPVEQQLRYHQTWRHREYSSDVRPADRVADLPTEGSTGTLSDLPTAGQ